MPTPGVHDVRPTVTRAPGRRVWSSTFSRFSAGEFRIIGPLTLGVHDWTHPRPGRPVMFSLRFFEWFTCARPRTLALIYAPASAFFIGYAIHAGVSAAHAVMLFAAGLCVWTLMEYVMHRFLLHLTPGTRLAVAYAYLVHGVHHAFPEDDRRWLMPPVVTLPIAGLLLVVLAGALDVYGAPIYAGILFGYLCYDLLHYAIHRGPLPSRWGRALRANHLTHHYRTPESRFGVSTTIWDRLFGT